MCKAVKQKLLTGVLAAFLLTTMYTPGFAAEQPAEDEKFYLGTDSLVNTGKDTGYAESHLLDKDDPHWDWTLGEFYISGYTRATDYNGTPLFLKNVGDTVTLWFSLEQDIDCLNQDETLAIYEDENGWNQALGVPQQNFGRGMLIVKHTDYLNHSTITT